MQTEGSTSAPPFAIRDADIDCVGDGKPISIQAFYPGTYSLYARKYRAKELLRYPVVRPVVAYLAACY